MGGLLEWAEGVIDLMLRFPPIVGVLGSWTMTQAHKWMIPPKTLADYTDAQRSYRTRQVAFFSGVAFTLLAYMNPEVRTVASATTCYGVPVVGFGVCTPPLAAYVLAPIVGVWAIILWDVLMFGVEHKWPEFYRRYISGKPVKTLVPLPNGTQAAVVVDSRGRFLKLQVLEGDETETVLLPTVPGGDDTTERLR